MPRLIAEAARTRTAFEINSTPNRLDLPAAWACQALAEGIPLAINTDAHSADGLAAISLGVIQARRAGARPGQILNTKRLDALQKWLRTPKDRR